MVAFYQVLMCMFAAVQAGPPPSEELVGAAAVSALVPDASRRRVRVASGGAAGIADVAPTSFSEVLSGKGGGKKSGPKLKGLIQEFFTGDVNLDELRIVTELKGPGGLTKVTDLPSAFTTSLAVKYEGVDDWKSIPVDCKGLARQEDLSVAFRGMLTLVTLENGDQRALRIKSGGLDKMFTFPNEEERERMQQEFKRVCGFVAGLSLSPLMGGGSAMDAIRMGIHFNDRGAKCCVCPHKSGFWQGLRKPDDSHPYVYHSESGTCGHCNLASQNLDYKVGPVWTSWYYQCEGTHCHKSCLTRIPNHLEVQPSFTGVRMDNEPAARLRAK